MLEIKKGIDILSEIGGIKTIDDAKKILEEEGYPQGFKVEVLAQSTPEQIDILSVAKEYWADIGVDLEIIDKEYGVYHSMWINKSYDMYCSTASGTNPTGFTYIHAGSFWNSSMVNDPHIEEVRDQVMALVWNWDKKAELLRSLYPYILDEAYCLQLGSELHHTFWQPYVKGYNGELTVGYYDELSTFAQYLWIDQDLKYEMTRRR